MQEYNRQKAKKHTTVIYKSIFCMCISVSVKYLHSYYRQKTKEKIQL